MIDPTITHIKLVMPRRSRHIFRSLNDEIGSDTTPISIRWSNKDREFIGRQANTLGLSFSEFVRWCACYAAQEIHRIDLMTSYTDAKASAKRKRINKDEYSDDTQ